MSSSQFQRVRRAVVAGLVLLLVLTQGSKIVLAAAPAHETGGAGLPSPAQLDLTCDSSALGGKLPALVYLPVDYSDSAGRYPVIYFLHGLPGSTSSYRQNGFVADALSRARRRAIVVAPQGVRGSGADSDREYLDWSEKENWPLAIARDLTACVDQRFRTIATRRGRALIGLSAGGYGAFNIGLRNLATFGAVESWSGYFTATDPSGHHALRFATRSRQQAAAVPQGAELRSSLSRHPSLVAFYVGVADDRFAQDNRALDQSLRHDGIQHVFRAYPGGHSVSLWQARAPDWLSIALTYLATGRTVQPAQR